jgi:hypothetical protein
MDGDMDDMVYCGLAGPSQPFTQISCAGAFGKIPGHGSMGC